MRGRGYKVGHKSLAVRSTREKDNKLGEVCHALRTRLRFLRGMMERARRNKKWWWMFQVVHICEVLWVAYTITCLRTALRVVPVNAVLRVACCLESRGEIMRLHTCYAHTHCVLLRLLRFLSFRALLRVVVRLRAETLMLRHYDVVPNLMYPIYALN